MKLSKIAQISIKRFLQNKKRNIIIILPLTMMIVILLLVNMIRYSTEKYIQSLEGNIDMRNIEGIKYAPSEYESVMEKLQSIDNIDMIVREYENRVYADKQCSELEYMSNVSFKPANNKVCPEVLQGRKIEDTDKYVIILPNKIYNNEFEGYANNSIEMYKDPSRKYLNGEEFFGKTLTIQFTCSNGNKTSQDFEVIGIYDVDKYHHINAFIPPKVIAELNEKLEYDIGYYQIKVVVDKLKNLESVAKQIEEKGIGSSSAIQAEHEQLIEEHSAFEFNFAEVTNISLDSLEIIQKLIMFLYISAFIILISILIVSNLSKHYLAIGELGILKVEGYTDSDIQKITIIENIFVCIFSIIMAILIFAIICLIGNNIIDYIMEKEYIGITMNEIKEQLFYIRLMPQRVSIKMIIILSIVITFIEVINTFFINKRILSKNISTMIKE